MSKIYDKYIYLKANLAYKENTLFLFKTGLFFIFIDQDAYIASELLHLKLGKLNDTIVKCGFPFNSIEKYLNLLKNTGYTVEIISLESDKTLSSSEYIYTETIKNLIEDFIKIDIDTLSISQAYDVLYNLKNDILNAQKNIKIDVKT